MDFQEKWNSKDLDQQVTQNGLIKDCYTLVIF